MADASERMRRKIKGIRFALGTPDGPRSTVWRVWVSGDEVYIAARGIGDEMKVSLHSSGTWRYAFTEKHLAREKPLIDAERDRAVDRWRRPHEFAPGWTRAFSILIPTSELVASSVVVEKPNDIIWLDPLPEGWAARFTVLLSAPGATGTEGRGFATAAGRENDTEVVTVLPLRNSERVWVVAHAEEVDAGVARMIEDVRRRATALDQGGGAIAAAKADATEPTQIRMFAGGHEADGTRFFLDVALPEEARAA